MEVEIKIAALRTKAGLTQLELAIAMGVDPSSIRNIEKGRAGIDQIVRIIKLCRALECSVEDLLEFTD
jgi:transcriptional regulator with XRE-family HTH domain